MPHHVSKQYAILAREPIEGISHLLPQFPIVGNRLQGAKLSEALFRKTEGYWA